MAQSTLTAPRLPSQAEIDAAVGRGRRLRSLAIREAFLSLFTSNKDAAWTPKAQTAA